MQHGCDTYLETIQSLISNKYLMSFFDWQLLFCWCFFGFTTVLLWCWLCLMCTQGVTFYGYDNDDNKEIDTGAPMANSTTRELQRAFEDSKLTVNGGSVKYAIRAVSRLPHIPRVDQAKLRILMAETTKEQLKWVRMAWEEGIQHTDRPHTIYEKLMKLNSYKSESKLMDNIVDAKKLPYSTPILIHGASLVMVERVRNILLHLRVPQDEIDAHLMQVQQDFGKVSQQVNKDLILCQNEKEIVKNVQRCLRTYIKDDSVEAASIYDLYMRGHAAIVQAAEIRGNDVHGDDSLMALKDFCEASDICFLYQTRTCPHGPRGVSCKWKHMCLWCHDKRHQMCVCPVLIPRQPRPKNGQNGQNRGRNGNDKKGEK